MLEPADRDALIHDVVERELVMFLNTRNEGGTASCQENPEMFRNWRWMVFSVMSDDYILSYQHDLQEAEKNGRNFMVEKYARMDNLIPCVSPNMDKVRAIVAAERVWLVALSQEFPTLFPDQTGRFDFYFSAEMETLSEASLDQYLLCIDAAKRDGRNLAKERYANMYDRMGLGTLEEAEAKRRQQ